MNATAINKPAGWELDAVQAIDFAVADLKARSRRSHDAAMLSAELVSARSRVVEFMEAYDEFTAIASRMDFDAADEDANEALQRATERLHNARAVLGGLS